MKTSDLLLLGVIGFIGWMLYTRSQTPITVAPTATMNPTGGVPPSTTSDLGSSIANAIAAAFNFGSSIAQSTPKTT